MSWGNLFGGGDTSEVSSTTTQVNTAINPMTAASNGTAVSGVVNGNNSSVTNNVTTLDAQLAGHVVDSMLTATQDALLFGHDSQKQAYAFGGKVLDFAAYNNDSTMAFANQQTKQSHATSVAAIDSASNSMDKALAFGARQTGVALDSLSKSATMIDTAYKDAKGVLGTNVILVGIGATVLVLYFALRKG